MPIISGFSSRRIAIISSREHLIVTSLRTISKGKSETKFLRYRIAKLECVKRALIPSKRIFFILFATDLHLSSLHYDTAGWLITNFFPSSLDIPCWILDIHFSLFFDADSRWLIMIKYDFHLIHHKDTPIQSFFFTRQADFHSLTFILHHSLLDIGYSFFIVFPVNPVYPVNFIRANPRHPCSIYFIWKKAVWLSPNLVENLFQYREHRLLEQL